MAKLDDTPLWGDVYQLEETDPVIGGTPNPATGAGMDNIPHLQLAQRTSWLKDAVDTLTGAVVAASTTVAGLVRLSTAVNSTSTTTAATPSAVKAANDNAEIRALKSTTLTAGDGLTGGGTLAANRTLAVDGSVVRSARSVTGAGLATGGGSLSADRVITVPDATQAEALAGTSTAKAMSPLRVAQAIAATIASYVPSERAITAGDGLSGGGNLGANRSFAVDGSVVRTTRSISAGGLATGGGALNADRTISVPAATQAEAEAGTSTTKAMTPLSVKQAFEAMLAQRRYVSPKTTIENASSYTFSHGLGAVPAMIFVTLECVVAQSGYAVGSLIQLGIDANPDGLNEAIGVRKSSTNITVLIGSNGPGVYMAASGGGGTILTAANWKMIVTAIL